MTNLLRPRHIYPLLSGHSAVFFLSATQRAKAQELQSLLSVVFTGIDVLLSAYQTCANEICYN